MTKQAFLWIGMMLIMTVPSSVFGQKYFTRDGKVSFFSSTPIEDIEAHNKKATSVIDLATGQLEFAVLIKAFQFEKALMQEHFNENYMESDKFPKAQFKGKAEGLEKVDLAKNGTYPVKVKGDLTIHGVTKQVEADGNFLVKNGELSALAAFEVAPEDYGIKIPSVVRNNIAKIIRIDIDVNYADMSQIK
jgi:polyisoprenoid-binding protein YceI